MLIKYILSWERVKGRNGLEIILDRTANILLKENNKNRNNRNKKSRRKKYIKKKKRKNKNKNEKLNLNKINNSKDWQIVLSQHKNIVTTFGDKN